jgi:cytosine/adenosine deaminase-related metal-dependent hydrolase
VIRKQLLDLLRAHGEEEIHRGNVPQSRRRCRMSDFLVRNATPSSPAEGRARPARRAATCAVRGGKIAEIGTLDAAAGREAGRSHRCVVYPSWVNTHHHLFQSLLKGEPQGLNATLSPWLVATPMRLRPLMTEGRLPALGARRPAGTGAVGCATGGGPQLPLLPGMALRRLGDPVRGSGEAGAALRPLPRRRHAVAATQRGPAARVAPETLDGFLRDVQRVAREFHDPAPEAMQRVGVAPTDAAAFDAAGGNARDGRGWRAPGLACTRTCRRPCSTTTRCTTSMAEAVPFCESANGWARTSGCAPGEAG